MIYIEVSALIYFQLLKYENFFISFWALNEKIRDMCGTCVEEQFTNTWLIGKKYNNLGV